MLQRQSPPRRCEDADEDEKAVTYGQVTDGLLAAAAMSSSDSFVVDWSPPNSTIRWRFNVAFD